MISDSELKSTLKQIAKKRGLEIDYDRFESDSFPSGRFTLHADVIEVDKSGPAAVFIPGTSAYALLYSEFLSKLADNGYNVVGFDPRGHGRSTGDRGSYTISELMEDTRAALAYTKKRFEGPVAVIGSSQGGIVAFYIAATDEKIAGVVCHNVADLGDPSSVRLTRRPNLGRVLKPLLKITGSIAPEMKIPIDMYLDLSKEEMRGYGNAKNYIDQDPLAVKSISLKALVSLATEKLPRPVESITTPVQILHAGNDNIFPRDYIEDIYKRLTCRKSLKLYPGLPHLILTEHVDTVMPDVKAWLDEIRA